MRPGAMREPSGQPLLASKCGNPGLCSEQSIIPGKAQELQGVALMVQPSLSCPRPSFSLLQLWEDSVEVEASKELQAECGHGEHVLCRAAAGWGTARKTGGVPSPHPSPESPLPVCEMLFAKWCLSIRHC